MTDKEIVERAKEAEKRTSFGVLVHRPISKGVNSAFGIGFIEGMVEYRNSLQEEPVSEDRKETILKKAHELANKAERISGVFPKSTLIAVACDMAEWCDTHPIKEPVSKDLEEAAWMHYDMVRPHVPPELVLHRYFIDFFKAGAQWQFAQLENNRLAACDRQTKEEAEREQDFVDKVLLGEQRQPTYSDAIEYGIQWQKKQTIEKACEWLKENAQLYLITHSGYIEEYDDKTLVDDFRKALEEDGV